MKSEEDRYQEYLCSREWGVLKEFVRTRSSGTCERCFRNPAYAVHHLTYVRKYQELPEDLQHVCEGCHEFIHGKSDQDPCKTISREVYFVGAEHQPLKCPCCEADWSCLHHSYVIVWNRDDEDGDVTETIIDSDNKIERRKCPSKGSRNPSSRRDGIAIGFWCELCPAETELTIEQHKGSTFLAWRLQPDKKTNGT